MVWGVLMIGAGILAIVVPAPAALAFTLLLSWLFVFTGVVLLVYHVGPPVSQNERIRRAATSVIRPTVFALLIIIGWPQNSIGFVGILVGVCMISGGVWRIVLGQAMRSGVAPAKA